MVIGIISVVKVIGLLVYVGLLGLLVYVGLLGLLVHVGLLVYVGLLGLYEGSEELRSSRTFAAIVNKLDLIGILDCVCACVVCGV